jgi:LysM repeat protein
MRPVFGSLRNFLRIRSIRGVCRLLLVGIGAVFVLSGYPAQAEPSRSAAQEDARAERLLILKTADQIDLIRGQSDKLQGDLGALQTEMAKLREENASLQQDVAALKTALTQAEAREAKERETLLAEIAKLVSGKSAGKSSPASAPAPAKSPPPAKTVAAAASSSEAVERGFYHVVEKGQTLSLIAKAYRDQGVPTSVEAIRKANSLAGDGPIRVGQKLFIPKG